MYGIYEIVRCICKNIGKKKRMTNRNRSMKKDGMIKKKTREREYLRFYRMFRKID